MHNFRHLSGTWKIIIGLIALLLLLVGIALVVGDRTGSRSGGTAAGTGPNVNGEVSEGYASYTDTEFGFSFFYPKGWQVSESGNTVTIAIPGTEGDRINIVKIEGDRVQNTDTKFGSVSYFYDPENGLWMYETDSDVISTSTRSGVAIGEFHTVAELPVFKGTQRWKTDIVALSVNKFLVFNITGGGNTAPLDPIVKTVMPIGVETAAEDLNTVLDQQTSGVEVQ